MNSTDRIYIAGHEGMLGGELYRELTSRGFANLLTASRNELDLRDGSAVRRFFAEHRPQYVFLAAGKVGGIKANMEAPADFLYDNLAIAASVIKASAEVGVRKLLYVGSSCMYPRECPQPMREDSLLTGPLEPTNEGYAIAKIAGAKLCQTFREQYGLSAICPVPCNLYGPGDDFDPATSHVLAALVRKFCDAVERGENSVTLWGTGAARRELMHVRDAARALLFLMDEYNEADIVNVGTGKDHSIREIASIVKAATGFEGEVLFDATMPDGMPVKRLDVSKLESLGFKAQMDIQEGVGEMVALYRSTAVNR